MLAGTLEVEMLANIARLSQDMEKAKHVVSSAMGSVEKAVNSAKQALGALGLGLGINQFLGFINGAIDAADRLNDLNKATKISVETLAGIKVAARQSGADLDSVAKAIQKLGQNAGKAPEEFKKLGLSAKDNLGLFLQTADLFNLLEDGQLRNATMAKLLGKEWQTMAPLLSEGSAKIREMVERGTQLSGMTKQMAEDSDAYKDKMVELNTVLGSLAITFTKDLLPPMTRIVNEMVRAKQEGGGFASIMAGLGRYLFEVLDGVDDPIRRAERELTQFTELYTNAQNNLDKLGDRRMLDQKFLKEQLDNIDKLKAKSEDALKWLNQLRSAQAGIDKEKATENPEAAAAERAAAARRAAAFAQTNKEREERENAYRNLIKSIDELNAAQQAELDGSKALTEGQKLALKMMVDLRDGKVQYTDAEKIELRSRLELMLATDAELQKKKELVEIDKILLDQAVAAYNETERLREVVSRANSDRARQVKDIQFETDMIKLESQLNGAGLLLKEDEIKLISRVTAEREKAQAIRQIDLELERDILALGPEITEQTQKFEAQLRANAQARKEQVSNAIDMREQARLGNELARTSVDEFKNLWSSVESMGKTAFVNLFSSGKSTFEALGQSLKAALIDLLYELTVKKWIISIGANISGSFASNAAGSLGSSLFGGGGGGGGFSPSSLMNVGKLFGGDTSWASGLGGLTGGAGLSGTLMADSIMAEMVGGAAATASSSAIGAGALSALGPYAAAAGIGLALFGGDLFGDGGGDHNDPRWDPKAIEHFDPRYGGRPTQAPSWFDSEAYLAQNPDVAGLYGFNPYDHYIAWGQGEGRKLAPDNWIPRAVREMNAARDAQRDLLSQQMDPVGYWSGKQAQLSVELGFTGSTVIDWQNQFMAALDSITSQEQLDKWNKLGEAIKQAGELAGNTANEVASRESFGASLNARGGMLASLGSFVQNLSTSEYLSPLDRLANARSTFEETLAKARAGDRQAAMALGGAGSTYLDIGRSAYASSAAFQDIFTQVRGGVSDTIASNQQGFEQLLRETPAAIQSGFADQIKALRDGFDSVVTAVDKLSSGMRQAGAAV